MADYASYSDKSGSEESSNEESELGALTGKDAGQDSYCCPVFCTMTTFCHCCYVVLFFTYMVLFPLWCKWLFYAPKPFSYWGEGYPDFPRIRPFAGTYVALGLDADPEIKMSPIPSGHEYCNFSCTSELGSQVSFDVAMTLNADLASHGVHTLYPVLFASNDFVNWNLVADRRNAHPEPFWRQDQSKDSHLYQLDTPACTRPVVDNETFTSAASYILACVTWSASKLAQLQQLTSYDDDTVRALCDAAGGVCGYSCNSNIDSSRLEPTCSNGVIQVASLLPESNFTGRVQINRCEDSTGECITVPERMSMWQCPRCETRTPVEESVDDEYMRRRLQMLAPREPPPKVNITKRPYTSFPRMKVIYDHFDQAVMPEVADRLSTPSVFVMATSGGPNRRWVDIYPQPDAKHLRPLPAGASGPRQYYEGTAFIGDDPIKEHSMKYIATDKVLLKPDHCYGARGDMYVVGCAINQSAYDQLDQWHNNRSNPRFKLGQAVAGPPFNDRCFAVAGRCGAACLQEGAIGGRPEFCQEDGYIAQEHLIDKIEVQFNREPLMYLFIFALLCGFAVKTVMLCPGIYSPYQRCRFYSPEMTEQVRYLAVVGLFADADEGKGAMIRNLVGMLSSMPPACQCRYHVVACEEGHRAEMYTCWQRFCQVVAAVPPVGDGYDDNLLQLMHTWVEETQNLTLAKVGAQVAKLEPAVLDKLSGKSTLKKMLKDSAWSAWDKAVTAELERAMDALAADLDKEYNVFSTLVPYMDVIEDWEPRDAANSPLRMHFVSRAKPYEDPRRTMKVQHVSEGTWYYTVPPGAHPQHWLQLRQRCNEMPYSLADDGQDGFQVPMISHHGKVGGLNFADNYLGIVAERPENLYGDQKDDAPSLFAIADGRHQFQPDFMLSCLPCFFDTDYELNSKVAYAQAPPTFPPSADIYASKQQFFRLYAMIRNCCGGVSPATTNTMWLLPFRDASTLWETRRPRVRDVSKRKRRSLFEREEFNTSCRIEVEATSMDRVFKGQYSHFVNRKLSFGMAKDPDFFLGAQQRRIEGAVALSMQWMSFNAVANGVTDGNSYMLWATLTGFILYIFALNRLACQTQVRSIFTQLGLVSESSVSYFMDPISEFIHQSMHDSQNHLQELRISREEDVKLYSSMMSQFVLWICTAIFFWLLLRMVTMTCKCFRRCCYFPSEMKWWGRLLISMDNITYFVWCWTPLFWLGFLFYAAICKLTIHVNAIGLTVFMLVLNAMQWGLIISSSLRYSMMESMDANEIAKISLDNIWRANQLFFITGPLQIFSIFTGFQNFTRYRLYGQDIGDTEEKDRTAAAVFIVKFWTLLLILGSVFCWVWFIFVSHAYENALPACIVLTILAMDMLPVCAYLIVHNDYSSDAEARQMRWAQALSSGRYWRRMIFKFCLADLTVDVIRITGPLWLIIMPFLTLWNPFFGVVSAFALVSISPVH